MRVRRRRVREDGWLVGWMVGWMERRGVTEIQSQIKTP